MSLRATQSGRREQQRPSQCGLNPLQHLRSEQKNQPPAVGFFNSGGEEEDRTPDLVIANDALSQLSYFPGKVQNSPWMNHSAQEPVLIFPPCPANNLFLFAGQVELLIVSDLASATRIKSTADAGAARAGYPENRLPNGDQGDQPALLFRPGHGAGRQVGRPRCFTRHAAPRLQLPFHQERWMSGLSRTPGKRVWVNSPPRVRIPLSPPVPRAATIVVSP